MGLGADGIHAESRRADDSALAWRHEQAHRQVDDFVAAVAPHNVFHTGPDIVGCGPRQRPVVGVEPIPLKAGQRFMYPG